MTETEVGLEFRPYRTGDESGILSTFNRVFREVCGDGFVDREMGFWRWSFAECPSGQRIWLALADDGTVAAQYACVPHEVDSPFGTRTFLHTVDSMVHPDFRAGLKRPGLFVRLTREFQGACRARGDSLTYGYPVRSAERIGQRYLDYENLGVVDYLVRELDDVACPANVSVERVARFDVPGALRQQIANEQTCATRRDDTFLDWRYVRAPGAPYVILEARRAGDVTGYAVVRPRHELIPGACTIADWIVPSADHATRDALIAAAVDLAKEHERRVLMTVFAAVSPEFTAFRNACGFAVEPSKNTLERRMTIVHFGDEFTNEWLREHWWYTLGDSDLV